jgi:hypothetical protein
MDFISSDFDLPITTLFRVIVHVAIFHSILLLSLLLLALAPANLDYSVHHILCSDHRITYLNIIQPLQKYEPIGLSVSKTNRIVHE